MKKRKSVSGWIIIARLVETQSLHLSKTVEKEGSLENIVGQSENWKIFLMEQREKKQLNLSS